MEIDVASKKTPMKSPQLMLQACRQVIRRSARPCATRRLPEKAIPVRAAPPQFASTSRFLIPVPLITVIPLCLFQPVTTEMRCDPKIACTYTA